MPNTALHRACPALLLATAALLPAACNQAEPTAEPTGVVAMPDAPAGIAVTDARLVLPPVSGNPGAVYFTLRNGGDTPMTIAAASVTGAGMAMLHTTKTEGGAARMEHVMEVPVPAGGAATFAPGGMHVMVEGLGAGMVAGGQAEVTLTFANGDKVSFPAEIRRAGDAR